MLKFSSTQPHLSAAVLLCSLIASPLARAACGCPDDGHGASTPKVGGTGLGMSNPANSDLAADPAWQVYEFARDGIRYVQVNDLAGAVRVAVGRIDGTLWVLPIGADVDRVFIGVEAPAGAKVIYRTQDVEVVLYRKNNQDRWFVRKPAPVGAAQ